MEGFKPQQDNEPKKKVGNALGYAAALAAGAIGGVAYDNSNNIEAVAANKNTIAAPTYNSEHYEINRLSLDNKRAIADFLRDPEKGLVLNLTQEEVAHLGDIRTTLVQVKNEVMSDPSGQFDIDENNVVVRETADGGEEIVVTAQDDDGSKENEIQYFNNSSDIDRILYPNG